MVLIVVEVKSRVIRILAPSGGRVLLVPGTCGRLSPDWRGMVFVPYEGFPSHVGTNNEYYMSYYQASDPLIGDGGIRGRKNRRSKLKSALKTFIIIIIITIY